MSQLNLSAIKFWAKTTKDDLPGISVLHHMVNVGMVAENLIKHYPYLMKRFNLSVREAVLLAALHDIGKISQGFQSKCAKWLEQTGMKGISTSQAWQNFERYHEKVSQFTVQNLLLQDGMKTKSAIHWAVAPGAHHGYLHRPGERGLQETAGMKNDEWEQERQRVARQLIEALAGGLPKTEINRESAHLWWLAGLISVSDWIGSDETYFPIDRNLEPEESQRLAQVAVEAIGFTHPEVRSGLSFEELFPFPQNDLQREAVTAITEPGIYVIEAPMGMGKTEAALACAYRLICEGKASGIYFALPTQATSNRIHLRVDDFVRKIWPDGLDTRLIHANSWLIENLSQPVPAATVKGEASDDARAGRDWFASAKRALIAPFGVGTVDQALLSVVAAKHFFVRRFGLAGKVVILDEVHSYDFYTGTLIRVLCETLEKLGCTVILLSATLTPERRTAFLGKSDALETNDYPLISGRRGDGTFIKPRPAQPPEEKKVHVAFVENEYALPDAWKQACNGACVLWICNTVARAQSVYTKLEVLAQKQTESPAFGLLHSRFPHFRREELETYWMELLGKDSKNRRGCVLVSTQIVEQSVDLDADLLITELAPTDMLLQRIGRLWRHPRGKRPAERAECWIIGETATLDELRAMKKEEIRKALGAKAWVYAPYVLLRSLEIWSARDARDIAIPTEIRNLLSETYDDRDEAPDGWKAWQEEILGDEFAKKKTAEMNSNIWSPLLDDQEGVQTRVSTVVSVQLILSAECKGKQLALLNCEQANLSDDKYRLDAARALHRNLVKIPKSEFAAFRSEDATSRYVKGEQAVALVQPDGSVNIAGLKDGRTLHWHIDRGLEIRRGIGGREEHEPCD
jgi:CRISPR-associated endonuclease/helicase Cas3